MNSRKGTEVELMDYVLLVKLLSIQFSIHNQYSACAVPVCSHATKDTLSTEEMFKFSAWN
jgi:hypothetical protein